MSSKFFGNRTEKHSIKKKGAKQKFNNKSNKAKSVVLEKLEEEDNILNHS